MGSQDDTRLIEQVRKHYCLYDPRMRGSKDSPEKVQSWTEIGNALGIKPTTAKNRWRSLRDKFVREKKRLVTDGETTYSQRDPWPLLEDMAFLWDFVTHRSDNSIKRSYKQQDNSSRTLPTNLPQPSPESVSVSWEYDTTTMTPPPGNCTNTNEEQCIILDGKKAILKGDPDDDDMLEEDEDEEEPRPKLRTLLEPSRNHVLHKDESSEESHQEMRREYSSQVVINDEDELFCLSVASSLKRFSARKRALAKLRIQQVLYEVEFRTTQQQEATADTNLSY